MTTNDHPAWTVESTVRLNKLTLFVLKDGDPRGTITFEDSEEEEAVAWVEMITSELPKLLAKPSGSKG